MCYIFGDVSSGKLRGTEYAAEITEQTNKQRHVQCRERMSVSVVDDANKIWFFLSQRLHSRPFDISFLFFCLCSLDFGSVGVRSVEWAVFSLFLSFLFLYFVLYRGARI